MAASEIASVTQPFVRADVRAFLDILNATPAARIGEFGAAETRAVSAQMRAGRSPVDHNLAIVRDLSFIGPGGEVGLRFYDARVDRPPGPVAVYFHGGGFVLGDLESHHPFCIEIARLLDLPVVSVDYRLAPEHPWPAAPEDAEAAARWITDGAGEVLGQKVTGLVLIGDSAGANLSAITARALRDAPAAAPVIAQALIYPTTGDNRRTPSKSAFADGYFLTQKAIDWFNQHYAAPVGDPRYDLFAFDQAGMPPTLLVTAGLDPLRDEGRDYAAALIQAGVSVVYQEAEGNIHGCFSMAAAIPSSANDVARALAALRLLAG
jgi:acetyl esterase